VVAPKVCDVCGSPPVIMAGSGGVDWHGDSFVVACARGCVPDSVHGDREACVQGWNKAVKIRKGI
jgi:ferredoxin